MATVAHRDVVFITGGQVRVSAETFYECSIEDTSLAHCLGFIGAACVKQLMIENDERKGAMNRIVVFDVKQDDNILKQVLTAAQLATLERVYGDIADTELIVNTIESVQPTFIIHLAGLQIPTCRANPLLGARVNVLGTLNVFEAARLFKEKHGRVINVTYASSAAVSGNAAEYTRGPIPDDEPHRPLTHYGVFKQANEGNARVYWEEHKIPSAGLRPFTVYGVGREVGVTSGPTKALKAAVLGRPYKIAFSGELCLNFVDDVADYFIGCGRAKLAGAHALNLKGDVITVDAWIKMIEELAPHAKGTVTAEGNHLPFPIHFLETGLETILAKKPVPTTAPLEGIRRTYARFQQLKTENALHDRDL